MRLTTKIIKISPWVRCEIFRYFRKWKILGSKIYYTNFTFLLNLIVKLILALSSMEFVISTLLQFPFTIKLWCKKIIPSLFLFIIKLWVFWYISLFLVWARFSIQNPGKFLENFSFENFASIKFFKIFEFLYQKVLTNFFNVNKKKLNQLSFQFWKR